MVMLLFESNVIGCPLKVPVIIFLSVGMREMVRGLPGVVVSFW